MFKGLWSGKPLRLPKARQRVAGSRESGVRTKELWRPAYSSQPPRTSSALRHWTSPSISGHLPDEAERRAPAMSFGENDRS